MNILNYDIKRTKLFKKIMISICSMMMVFASCFAPYSKVKALVGIDDVALSYVALSVLGLCGITLAGTTLSNTDITKLGSDVAGSISRTFDTLGKTVSDRWNLLIQTAGATGKIALDYVNDLKGNIQDWWNGLGKDPEELLKFNTIAGFTLSNYFGTKTALWSEGGYDASYFLPSNGPYESAYYIKELNIMIGIKNRSYPIFYNNDGVVSLGFISSIYKDNLRGIDAFDSYKYYLYLSPDSEPIEYNSNNLYTLVTSFGLSRYLFSYDVVKGAIGRLTLDVSNGNILNYQFINDINLQLGLDSKLTGSFKLDDRVLGATGTLSLADKIIGAVGSLDLDLTNNVVKSYGYVDVPSTTLDYPYTGTWDSTLDGIGAIAWAPSTDIPIADTNVIAPTLPGTTDTDIPKVKDFTGKGTDLTFDWKGVFPFCIPFDLIKFIQCFCADPEAPKFEIPVNIPKIYKGDIKVDLSGFDEVAALCRTLFDILFILGLAYATRYLIKG